jgi:Glycosyl transferases group 1
VSVRVTVTSDIMSATGGKELAIARMATVLAERGHDVGLLYGAGELPPLPTSIRVERIPSLHRPTSGSPVAEVVRAVASARSELVIMGVGWPEALDALTDQAPVILTAQTLAPICPDGSKFWSRTSRACTVPAGPHCLAIRPVLGCAGRRDVVRLAPYRTYRSLARLGRSGRIGIAVPGADERTRLLSHGYPPQAVTVLPNLGMCLSAEALSRAASVTPAADRGAVVFIGRLSQTKGAQLLPALAVALSPVALAVFGTGYLESALREPLGDALRGGLDQWRVAGVMQWARSLAFPSLWPEPGGIAGIDAQVMGVPTVAFDIGAARSWPQATLVPPRDIHAMADALRAAPVREHPREPAAVADAQVRYRTVVAGLIEERITTFAKLGHWPSEPADPVTDALRAARTTLVVDDR